MPVPMTLLSSITRNGQKVRNHGVIKPAAHHHHAAPPAADKFPGEVWFEKGVVWLFWDHDRQVVPIGFDDAGPFKSWAQEAYPGSNFASNYLSGTPFSTNDFLIFLHQDSYSAFIAASFQAAHHIRALLTLTRLGAGVERPFARPCFPLADLRSIEAKTSNGHTTVRPKYVTMGWFMPLVPPTLTCCFFSNGN
jgi:hypothetical protein